MTVHRKVRLLLYDYVRGGLEEEEARMVGRHLDGCPGCAREAASHRELLKAVPRPSRRPSDALTDAWWTGFANDVMAKVEASPAVRPGLVERLFGNRGAGPGLIGMSTAPRRIAAGLAAAAVVAAAVWFAAPGTGTGPQGVDAPGSGSGTEVAASSGSRDAATDSLTEFDRRLTDYFRKSKTLLVGVSNIEPPEGEAIDLADERRISRSLLREARFLREGPVDPRSSRLIDDLDRILIGLANGEQVASRPDIEVLRGGIESRNLLFKLRMQETRNYRLPVQQASYQRQGPR